MRAERATRADRATRGARGRGVALSFLSVAAVLGVTRAALLVPERCPAPRAAAVESAAGEMAGWLIRHQNSDGTWLYGYDERADRVRSDYNMVRHAGVTMALYQAAAAGVRTGALQSADRGTAFALDRLITAGSPTARAFRGEPSGVAQAGASALLVAGLVERRQLTGDHKYDEPLRAMARFLAGQVEARGSVLAFYDPVAARPVPGRYSRYYTGETFWALTRAHRVFPSEGFDRPALRIARWLALHRDRDEGYWPDLSDHWAGYGFSEMIEWQTATRPSVITDVHAAYLGRQARLFGPQVRFVAQSRDRWGHIVRGGDRSPGGIGTVGEGLAGIWRVAAADRRLAPLGSVIAARVACNAAVIMDIQRTESEATASPRPDLVRGAVFRNGQTRMDDQQHAMSALLRALPIVATIAPGSPRGGEGAARSLHPSLVIGVLALLSAWNAARIAELTGASRSGAAVRGAVRDRVGLGAAGAAIAATVVLAFLGATLRDALGVSASTMRLAAGVLVASGALLDFFFTSRRSAKEGSPSRREISSAIVIPGLVRPEAIMAVASIAVDHGNALLPVLVAAAAALSVGFGVVRVPDSLVPWLRRLIAGVGVLAGVVMAVNGVLDV